MILQNLHTHSTFDDGKNTPEEMVLAAMAAGLTSIGMSVHAPMDFDNDWTLPKARLPEYLSEITRLKEKYAGRIAVYSGIEWDVLSSVSLDGFDYVIGSVHHIPVGTPPYAVDNTAEETARFLREVFSGDADAAAEAYFAELDKVADNPRADIVGHFDLLTKFDEKRHFFDENSPRYRRAALRAMQKLVDAGKIFEINTGAMARGYRTSPYPSERLLRDLHGMGGRITISADAHAAGAVDCGFDSAAQLAKACGFVDIWNYNGQKFIPVRI